MLRKWGKIARMWRAHRMGSGLAAACTLVGSSALAADVDVACPRLDADAVQELRARARLTLRAIDASFAPERVAMRCTEERAWIEWQGPPLEILDLDLSADLVEGALDALERRTRAPRDALAPTQSPPPEPAPSPGEESQPADVALPRASAPRRRERDAARPRRTGGLGLGVVVEPRVDSVAFGPRLDLGIGSRGWAFLVTDSLRVDPTASTVLWGFAVGGAWGAPFAPDEWLGFAATIGVEGLAGVGREATAEAVTSDSSPVLTLGVRLATHAGNFALWTGADGGWRTSTLRLDEPYAQSLPQWFAGLSLGALLLSDPVE